MLAGEQDPSVGGSCWIPGAKSGMDQMSDLQRHPSVTPNTFIVILSYHIIPIISYCFPHFVGACGPGKSCTPMQHKKRSPNQRVCGWKPFPAADPLGFDSGAKADQAAPRVQEGIWFSWMEPPPKAGTFGK